MKTRNVSLFYLTLSFLLLAAAHAEPTIQTFDTKAAFLAATGAANATGPLPNLGTVADPTNPTGSATVGTVTFSLAPGGDSLYIGTAGTPGLPDWYPQTPGHDIALGYENLQVQTAAPVHALGFEVVEANATIPAYGGTPAASPLLVTLYSGVNMVGQFVIDVPDDVAAFVGVWSDTAFDRVTIIDSTGNDDDEYFGQFYTGTAPAPSRSFTAITGSGTAVPGGSGGVFTAFAESPAVGAGGVSFLGLGSAGSFGIYSGNSAIPQDPIRIADLSTAIPGGTGNFTGFTGLAAGGSRVSFIGTGAGQAGIYSGDSALPQEPIRIADLNTAISGGTGNFTAFTLGAAPSSPSVAANGTVVFFGAGASGQQGIYASVNTSLVRLADTATAIPDGAGSFTGFGDFSPCPVNAGHIGFVGLGSGGQEGIYDYAGGSLSAVVDTATPIPDGAGTFTGFGGLSLIPQDPDPTHPLRAAFIGSGTAGQQGVYSTASGPLARVADLKTPIPGGTGTFTSFSAVSAAAGHTAFIGLGSAGQKGIFLASGLTLVIAVGDILGGKEITDLRFGSTGLAPDGLAYIATFADGSEGVFVADAVRFAFSGFRAPVAGLPQVNRAKAGRSIPVTFSLDGFHGLDIFAPGFPASERVCSGHAAAPTANPGKSGLTYDAAKDEYTYVWKTEKRWAGTTRQLVLKLKDGAVYRANFTFK